ncbi:MAG: hypothetical protein ACI4EG_12515 [Fusicatenibacter sp.]|nr:hypothetical protein [Fusicatenibacter sp.]
MPKLFRRLRKSSSNCDTGFSEKDLTTIQNIVYGTDYLTRITDLPTLQKAADTYLDTNIKTLADQIAILSKAANAPSFFEAWEGALGACKKLILLEPYYPFQTLPSEQKKQLLDHQDAIFREFLVRSIDQLDKELQKCKTSRQRERKLTRFLESYQPYLSLLSEDSREFLTASISYLSGRSSQN